MAETLTTEDPMAGYDPNRAADVGFVTTPPTAPPGEYEFDPRREITPLGGRFFSDVENDSRLSRAAKTRLQTGYLDGMDDIQAQRQKLEAERLRNMLNRQNLEQGNMALAEMRRKQGEIARAAEVQKSSAGFMKGIIASDLPADEKRRQIAMYEIDNAASIATDPALRSTVETAKGLLPVPLDPLYSTKDMRDKLEAGVPPDVVLKGDPVEIGFYERIIAAQEKEQSDNLSERKAAAKEYRSTILELAKEPPSFMTLDEADAAGVDVRRPEDGGDPNQGKYLTPESQQKGRILIGLLSGQEGLAAYEKLSDAERRDAIMVAQRDAMYQALQKSTNVDETSEEDVAAAALFAPKKR